MKGTTVLAPQQSNPPLAAEAQIRNAASAPAAVWKQIGAGAASRRKTLCDITNLRGNSVEEAQQQDGLGCANGVEGVAQLLKDNSQLVRLLQERDKFIELSGAEMQKLRLANWQLAQANSQMLAEFNLARDSVKLLQHELVCSRTALNAKSSELEEAKKAIKRATQLQERKKNAIEVGRHLASDKAATATQVKEGDAAAPASRVPASVIRKRMLRSRSLGPVVALTKPAPMSKEKAIVQRRKSMRMPNPTEPREEGLFEIVDVQLGIGGGHGRSEAAEQASSQFLRRSSLGRPLRRATERVTSYKEMPVSSKLRRS